MRRPRSAWSDRLALGVLAAAALAGLARARTLAFDQPGLQAPGALEVSLAGAADGGVLPTNDTTDGRNLSPPIGWTSGPAATAGYALVVEDADAPEATGIHWVAYDISKGLTALPRGVHNQAAPNRPVGMLQGPNDHGSFGYTGAEPGPPGAPPHHYHFQVFALDRPMRLAAGAPLARLERAMAGHVLARGEITLTYPPPPHTPKATDAAAPAALSPPP